jgi:hypothetical protein
MRFLIFFFFLLIEISGFSQVNEFSNETDVHAVVVGVSDYKNIRELKFAHRDAIAFADFISQNRYWFNNKEVSLLINENATAGNILAAMQQQLNNIDSSDLFIFYFAGHGDVETKTDREYSYLLAYDSPLNVYDLGGVISSQDLEKLLFQIANKGANSIIIIDACRSGSFDLAGSADGVYYTHQAFLKKSRSEIRILSSQENQKSLEKGDLGGGRGVFSYYLINGLFGQADNNKDSLIKLHELNSYVTEMVDQETQNSQEPKFQSDKSNYVLSYPITNKESIASNDIDALIESSRLSNRIIKGDSICNSHSNRFYKTIQLRGSSIDSVFSSYTDFVRCAPKDAPLIKEELISFLIDTVHEISINSLSGQKLVDHSELAFSIAMIDSICALSGDCEMFYGESMKRLKLYLNTMDYVYFGNDPFTSRRNSVLIDFKNQLSREHALNPSFAHISFALSAVYSKLDNIDSTIFFLNDAVKNSPTWLYPRYQLMKKYRETGQKEKAFEILSGVLQMDSLYKNYECFSCFFEEANYLIEDIDDPQKTNRIYADLLKSNLLSKEKSQILFYKYLNANYYLSTFESIWYYMSLKRQLKTTFSDRMIILTADVIEEKLFVSDKKFKQLIQVMDALSSTHELENYFSKRDYIPESLSSSDSKLFFKYFPKDMAITGYLLNDYQVFRGYILEKLAE